MKQFVGDVKNVNEFLKYMRENKIASQYVAADKLKIEGGYKEIYKMLKRTDKMLLSMLVSGISEIQNQIIAEGLSDIHGNFCGADDTMPIRDVSFKEKRYF